MDNNIKNLFEYLREIYQLKTKVVTDYTKYEKEIELSDFVKTYNLIADIHEFSEDLSQSNEYFILKYINNEIPLPLVPDDLKDIVELTEKTVKIKNDDYYKTDMQGENSKSQKINLTQEQMKNFETFKIQYEEIQKQNFLIKKYNMLYEFFFELNKRKQEFEEKVEVVLCKGLFVYKQNDDVIKRHIFEVPLLIDIDINNNSIFLKLDRNEKCNIETNFISSIQGFKIKAQNELIQLKSQTEEQYEDGEIIDYNQLYNEYLNDISFKYKVINNVLDMSEVKDDICYIFNQTNIIVRKKQPTVWMTDLNNIVNKIEQDGEFKTENKIIDLLLETDEEKIQQLLNSTPENTNVLFPLPSNDEQYKVVNQTQNSNLVLVQGPPGTGKSHTIANLISNYVANGKKVLVTSEKSKALEVIREKLPEEIKNLSIAVLNNTENDSELSNSIQIVLDKYKDKEYLNDYLQRISQLESQLQENTDKKLKNQNEIIQILVNSTKDNKDELSKFAQISLNSYMLIDIAKYLVKNNNMDIIKDYNKIENIVFNKEFLLELNSIIGDLKLYKDYILNKQYDFPTDLDLEKYQKIIENLQNQQNNEYISSIASSEINEKALESHDLHKVLNNLSNIIDLEKVFDKKFIKNNCIYAPKMKKVQLLINDIEKDKHFFETTETNLIGNIIEYDTSKKSELSFALSKVNEKVSDDGKIGLFEKMQILKECDLISDIKVNGVQLRDKNVTKDIVRLAIQKINYDIKIEKIKNTITTALNENLCKGIVEDEFSRHAQYIVNMLTTFIKYEEYISNLKLVLKDIFEDDEKVKNLLRQENYEEIYNVVNNIINYGKFVQNSDDYNKEIQELQSKTVKHCNMFQNIINASKQKDLEKYIIEKEKIYRIYKLDEIYMNLKEKYSNEIDNYKEFISTYIDYDEKTRSYIISNWDNILNYYKVKMYFYLKEKSNENFNNLLLEKEKLQKEEKKIIIELIEEKSWYNQINNMNNSTCRALSQWLTLKTKLGKGTGKKANLIRKEMQQQMEQAKNAIPIWIMPVDKVVEQYPFSEIPQFDIVIMDESSQSSIISITALLRGKKVIIVGDDKQISPMVIGITTEDLQVLQNKYLSNTCLGVGFDMETSLYDLAQNICGSKKVVLKEHFRCLPEIIEFSNLYFYGNQINCLKVRGKENTIKDPIKAEFVENATVKKVSGSLLNQKEVNRIIEIIKNIENDISYKNKTIGIIVLQNSSAQIKSITSEIWKSFNNDFIKNRRIKVGTTYDFQGDERDVIILSMITSKFQENGEENRIMALTKKEFERSFNVAATRAKEQVILVYSVLPENLSKECLRYKLITYYNTYNSIDNTQITKQVLETDFEKDVYERLTSEGVQLKPHFRVGNYTIDFVVENEDGKKVAIECDGDRCCLAHEYEADIRKQDVLERCGWKFIRVRASRFYYDIDEVVNDVLLFLKGN